MIFGQIKHKNDDTLSQGVRAALDFARTHDLAAFELGKHEIDGDDLFVNVVEYETTSPQDRFWEAHRDYLDVHVPLRGDEQIDLNFLTNMAVKDYEKAADFVSMDGGKNASIVMAPGDFLVCDPQDAHRTAVAVDGKPERIKKAIFKVKIEQ